MTAAILTIGDELLNGTIIDTNSTFIENELAKIGIPVRSKLCVRDSQSAIQDALNFLCSREQLIITSGGLGPTQDDLTRQSIAMYFNRELEYQPHVWRRLEAFFKKLNRKPAESNKSQAFIPAGSTIIPNDNGTAPGFIVDGPPLVASFPGVPRELKGMFPFLIQELKSRGVKFTTDISSLIVRTVGGAESFIDETLKRGIDEPFTIGTIASMGQIDLRFDFRSPMDEESALKMVREYLHRFPLVESKVFAIGRELDFPQIVVEELRLNRRRLVVAESCTGGLLSSLITKVPGSSEVFLGGLVTYHNQLKQYVLDVPAKVLQDRGAVSFETASAMLDGLKKTIESDYYVSITGIAGPDGGTDEKPVGTVFIGIVTPKHRTVYRFCFVGNRIDIQTRSAMCVLEMLWQDMRFGEITSESLGWLIDIKEI